MTDPARRTLLAALAAALAAPGHAAETDQGPGAPQFDIIFTVCDSAAAEACPIWPGHPMTVHWGIPDPAAAEGSEAEKRRAFAEAYRQLNTRISVLLALPFASLDRLSLKARLTAIGTL